MEIEDWRGRDQGERKETTAKAGGHPEVWGGGGVQRDYFHFPFISPGDPTGDPYL